MDSEQGPNRVEAAARRKAPEHRADPEGAGNLVPGIFAWFGIQVPFPDRVRMIKDAGFEATSIWWEQDNQAWRRLCLLMPDQVRAAGLHLENAHVPFRRCNALWSSDASERLAAVERHVGWVHDCARHGIPVMVMHCTASACTLAPSHEGIDSVRRIVDAAEGSGVTVALENTSGVAHIEALLAHIESPRLGLCYDSGHDWLKSDDAPALLRRWGHRLKATHLSDTDGVLDRHGLPGQGVVDLDGIGRALDWASYPASLLLEVVPRDRGQEPQSFLAEAFRAAQRVRRRLLRAGKDA